MSSLVPPAQVATLFKFANLPELCMLNIFSNLSLKDLFTVGMVNRRCHEMSRVALRQRKSLVIVLDSNTPTGSEKEETKESDDNSEEGASPSLPPAQCSHDGLDLIAFSMPICACHSIEDLRGHLGFNLINFGRLSNQHADSACDWLHSTFPHLKQLRIGMAESEPWQADRIAQLLRQCGDKLVRLELFCMLRCNQKLSHERSIVSNHQFGLLEAINGLPSLKHLVCEFAESFISMDELSFVETLQRTIDLPILSQLEHFRFDSADHATFLVDSLRKYAAPNRKLSHIELGNQIGNAGCWNQLLAGDLASQIGPRLRDIQLHLYDDHGSQFDHFAPYLTSVTALSIYVEKSISYHQLISQLAQLPRLTTLELSLNNSRLNASPTKKSRKANNLAPCTSVKHLRLDFFELRSHKDLVAMFHLDTVFPNLHELCIPFDIYTCRTCTYDYYDDYYHFHHQAVEHPDSAIKVPDTKLTMDFRKVCAQGLVDCFKTLDVHKHFNFKWWEDTHRGKPHIWSCEELGIEI